MRRTLLGLVLGVGVVAALSSRVPLRAARSQSAHRSAVLASDADVPRSRPWDRPRDASFQPARPPAAPFAEAPRTAKGWYSRRRGDESEFASAAPWRNKNRARNRAREWERLGDTIHTRASSLLAAADRTMADALSASEGAAPLDEGAAAQLLADLPRLDHALAARAAARGAAAAASAPPPPAAAAEPPLGPSAPLRWFEAVTFGGLSVGPELKSALARLGLSAPLPIQKHAFDPIRNRANAVVIASPTGTGKTLAILLPLLARLQAAAPASDGTRVGGAFRALILAPSTELAAQHVRTLRGLLERAADAPPLPADKVVTVALWTAADGALAESARNVSLRVPVAASAAAEPGAPAGSSAPAVDPFELATIVVATPTAALQRLSAGLSGKCWARLECLVLDEADALLTLRTQVKRQPGAFDGSGSLRGDGASDGDDDDDDDEFAEPQFDDDDGSGGGDEGLGAALGKGGVAEGASTAGAAPSSASAADSSDRRAQTPWLRQKAADEILAIVARKSTHGFAPASGTRLGAAPASAARFGSGRAPPAPLPARQPRAPAGARGWDDAPRAGAGAVRGWDTVDSRRGWDDEDSRRARAPDDARARRAGAPAAEPAPVGAVQLIVASATVGRALRKAVAKLTGAPSIADAAVVITPTDGEAVGSGKRAAGSSALMLPASLLHGYALSSADAADGAVDSEPWLRLVASAWHAAAQREAAASPGTAGLRAILFLRRVDSVADAAEALRASALLGDGVDVRELRAAPGEDGVEVVEAAELAEGESALFVASEHRARGLDMPRIGLVLVRGVSGASAATYVHCVGRSGRAGARGTAVALLSPAQAPAYAQLVQTLSLRLADELCSSDFVAAQ